MQKLVLAKGQKITVTLYKGNSRVEAQATFKFLKEKCNAKKSIPLGGSNFHIMIEDVVCLSSDCLERMDVLYKINLKGELL